MLPRSGSTLVVEGSLPTETPVPQESGGFRAKIRFNVQTKMAAREGCLSRASVTCYCAAGLWCTGGFLAAGAAGFISSTPFSMTIMNGLGVYDVGSP